MQIDWWTLALQAINFLVLVWLLWRFLYRPVREVIEKRKDLAERAFVETDKKKEEAEAARQHFEDARAELAQERRDMLKKLHEELEDERRNVLEEARHAADQLNEDTRRSIAREKEAVLKDIRDQVAELAADLAADLLRKAVPNTSQDVFLDQLVKQLKDLPADERDRLHKDLDVKGARLTVVTATPLAPEDQDRWIERLSAHLDQHDKTDFAADPGIVGGAELRFPHAVLRFTWADQLETAKDLLRRNDIDS